MSNFKAPSTALLRAFLRPSTQTPCQRQAFTTEGFMPRHKYAKVNRLDKLHRKQKQAIREERQASLNRAASMNLSSSPLFTPFSSTSTTTTTSSSPSPVPSLTPPSTSALPTLPFTIHRTLNRNLPVYETSKAGGSKHITQLRKLTGDLDTLASSLRTALNLPESYLDQKGRKKHCVAINRTTSQIVVRGWRGAEVKRWVENLGF